MVDDCLCMARKEEENKTIQVLIMKEYGTQESWITAFAIRMYEFRDNNYYGLTFYSEKKNAQVLIMQRSRSWQ